MKLVWPIWFFVLMTVGCGCKTKPAEVPDRWQDAAPTAEEAKRDPCELAAKNLATLDEGKPCSFWRPDYAEYCRVESRFVPMCPLQKAHAKTCKEAHEACR